MINPKGQSIVEGPRAVWFQKSFCNQEVNCLLTACPPSDGAEAPKGIAPSRWGSEMAQPHHFWIDSDAKNRTAADSLRQTREYGASALEEAFSVSRRTDLDHREKSAWAEPSQDGNGPWRHGRCVDSPMLPQLASSDCTNKAGSAAARTLQFPSGSSSARKARPLKMLGALL